MISRKAPYVGSNPTLSTKSLEGRQSWSAGPVWKTGGSQGPKEFDPLTFRPMRAPRFKHGDSVLFNVPGTTGFGYDGTVISNPEWKKGTYRYRVQYPFMSALVDYTVKEEDILTATRN